MDSSPATARVLVHRAPNAELLAGQLIEEVGLSAGFAHDTLAEVKLAVVEACLNAFEYGGADVEVEVAVRLGVKGPRIEVVVTDHGPGFDPGRVPAPDLQVKLRSARKRGWGLELMRRLMDEVEITSRPGLTQVRMSRCRGGE